MQMRELLATIDDDDNSKLIATFISKLTRFIVIWLVFWALMLIFSICMHVQMEDYIIIMYCYWGLCFVEGKITFVVSFSLILNGLLSYCCTVRCILMTLMLYSIVLIFLSLKSSLVSVKFPNMSISFYLYSSKVNVSQNFIKNYI